MQKLVADLDAAVNSINGCCSYSQNWMQRLAAEWMQQLFAEFDAAVTVLAELDAAVSSRTLSAFSSIGAVGSRTGCRNCNRTGNSS